MMKRIMLGGLALLLVFAMPAMAGKNNGGAMLVHTDDAINYTFFNPPDYCAAFTGLGLATCDDIVTQSNYEDPNGLLGAMVWLVAAFHPDADPGVKVVYFGINHSFSPAELSARGFCGPPNSLEVEGDAWPATNSGTSVAFGSPINGQHIFAFYWFGLYGSSGSYLATQVNPQAGYAAFVTDDDFLDQITRFGSVHWLEPGTKDCPVPPIKGACCLPTAECLLLFEAECEGSSYGGTYQGDGTTCTSACGACCYWDQDFDTVVRRCIVTTAEDCMDEESFGEIQIEVLQGDPPELELVGADWSYAGAVCTNDEEEADTMWWCQDPRDTPTATEETSWGQLKSLYR